jgi:uncharacterized protein
MNEKMQQIIIDTLLVYEPSLIGIFGSYARNEQTAESDLDILISLNKRLSLIDFARIKNELSDKLNTRIDLVSERAIHPKIKPYIEKDLQIIYHAKG